MRTRSCLWPRSSTMPRSFLVKKYFSSKRPNYSELHEHSDMLPEPFLLAELPEANGEFPATSLTTELLWDVHLVSSLQAPAQVPLDLSSPSGSPSSSSGEEDESRSSDPPSPKPPIPYSIPEGKNDKSASRGDTTTSDPSSQPPAFCCKHCLKEYSSLGALKMHIRSHTLPCVCNTCGKAFSRPWLLRGHIRTHTGERPFSCPSCSRAFADRSNLRAHLQTHAQVKKYQCSTCSRTFSRMSLLQKHNAAGCSV